jgi:putative Holliday junction resolvase
MALFNLTELRALLARDQRLIGLDPGAKTIGVALSDVRLMLASPYASLRRGKLRDNAAELLAVARKEGAGGLVVGLPLSMDGTAGPAAQAARDWTLALSAATGLPAALWDERLSTAAVNRFLIGEADLTRKKRAAAVDRAAAAWMLQAALDASRETQAAPDTPPSWSAKADHPRLPGHRTGKRRGSSAFAEDDEG